MVVMRATPFVLRAETSDGSLWFTEFTGNKIGKISKATGAIVEGDYSSKWFTSENRVQLESIDP
jgi:hypothetical protein